MVQGTISDERAAQYANDKVLFLQDQYIIPETRKLIVLEPWQTEWILKPLFETFRPDGRRWYNVALIGLPKKNGKSALGAGIGVLFLYTEDLLGEIIIAANSKDQSSMIIYNKMRRSIAANASLKKGTALLKDRIEVNSTGTTARVIAHQYESAAGLNPNLTIFDELWGFGDRRFYDELTVVPTRPNPLIVIVTYAGYQQNGLLWDLYSDGMEGEVILDTGDPEVEVRRGRKDPHMFMIWSHRNLASWITEEYIDNQRRRLPPDVFARLHENRWVSSSSQFVTEDDIDGLHARPWLLQTMPNTDRLVNYIVASDLGLSHDRTARVVGHFDPVDQNIYIDNIRLWQGTPEEHVPIDEVEQDIQDCIMHFKARKVVIDPWQMEYVIQRLKGKFGTAIVPFNFSTDMQHLSQIFVSMLRSKRIVSYNEPVLDAELRNTLIKQTMAGWRLDHAGKRRNDVIIATGMMMVEALKEQLGVLDMSDMDTLESSPVGFKGIRGKEF